MESAGTSATLYATVSTSATRAAEPEGREDLKHHLKDGKGFQNPWPSYRDFTPFSIIRQLLWRKIKGEINTPDTTPPTVPVQKPTFLPSRETPKLRATWLGHACFYVEFPSGLRVLFDPVFEPRCSPFTFMGPKRYTECPVQVEDIPMIDAVVISHSHYDHLSHPTVTKIAQKHPNAHFFVPLGLKKWFTDNKITTKVTELDWWDDCTLHLSPATASSTSSQTSSSTVSTTTSTSTSKPSSSSPTTITATISCLPAQHTSARTPFNKSATLWASWSIRSTSQSTTSSVYFAGDTGYRTIPSPSLTRHPYHSEPIQSLPHCPAFAQIGTHRGPFDLGLIPIGAYDPREIMSPMHANPYDSVEIFRDTKCRRALGMHWGTWVLTEEEVLEPPRVLKEALKERGMEGDVFGVCDIGESREFESGV